MRKLKYFAGGKRHAAQDEAFIDSLEPKTWKTGDSDSWDSCWYTGMPKPAYFKNLTDRQSINHIPGNNSLTIKSRLHQTLVNAQNRQSSDDLKNRYRFFPRIYDMPRDYHAFLEVADGNPDQKWILKPKNSSRGRGIEVVTDIEQVPSTDRWMVQQYLADPDLINDRKYVLRLYVLITSIDPLQVYLYREGFAKLASEPFSSDDLDNPYAHLTNPDINIHNDKVDEPVVFFSLENYKDLLSERGEDPEKLFSQIRDLVTLTLIASREKFRSRIERQKVNQHACYELLGLDCMIDKDLKPWILECNLSPSLETCSTGDDDADIESIIKTKVVRDMVQIRGLNGLEKRPRPSDFNDNAEFIAANLNYESDNSGDFERLYPASDTVSEYMRFFAPLKSDIIAAKAIHTDFKAPELYANNMVPEVIAQDNTLAIFNRAENKFIKLTGHESWLWVKLAMGTSLAQIEEDFVSEFSGGKVLDAEMEADLRAFPWSCLTRWVEKDYVGFAGSLSDSDAADDDISSTDRNHKMYETKLQIGNSVIDLACVDETLFGRIKEAYADFTADKAGPADVNLDITRGRGGFHLVENGRIGKRLLRGNVIKELNRYCLTVGLPKGFDLALDRIAANAGDGHIQIILDETDATSVGPDGLLGDILGTGIYVDFENNKIVPAGLPVSASNLTGKSKEDIYKRISFVAPGPDDEAMMEVSDPVEIMNSLSSKIVTPDGSVPVDLIRQLSEFITD